MTNQEKIDFIYEKIADKTLIIWSKIEFMHCWHNEAFWEWIYIDNKYVYDVEYWDCVKKYKNIWQDYLYEDWVYDFHIKFSFILYILPFKSK